MTRRWLLWPCIVAALAASHTTVWYKDEIAKLFKAEERVGGVHVGVLISSEELSGNDAQDLETAKEFLSERYHWALVERKKDIFPVKPFQGSTAFYLLPVSKKKEAPVLLTLR